MPLAKTFSRSMASMAALAVLLPASALAQQKRIAVLDFEYGTVRSTASAIFGTDIDVGRGIRDLMVEKFVKSGQFSVIERAALDKVLAEQNFSNSDRANPASAAQLGKLLGVDGIVIGSVTQFGRDDQTRKVGGGGFGNFGRKYGLGGVKQSNAKAVVAITARIIDTNTAEILAVANGRGESSRSGTALYGSGRASGAGGLGGVDMSSSNFGSTLIGEATTQAVDPVVRELETYKDRIARQERNISGVVADFDQGFVILNVGAGAGVRVGDRFEIKRLIREVRDPTTDRVIRRVEDTMGTAIATEVDDLSTVAKFSGDQEPQVGDSAKIVDE